jgi:glycerol kinase
LDIVEYFRSLPSLAGLGSPCWKSNEATIAGLILNLTLENVI